MNKIFYAGLMVLASIASACSKPEPKPMLVVNFDKVPDTQVYAVFDADGDMYYDDLVPDSTGTICYDPEFVGDAADVYLYVGSNAYGARIEKGKSTTMNISNNNATYEGDNIAASQFFNEYAHAYNAWDAKLKPGEAFNYQSATARIAAGHDAVAARLADIEDAALAEYYNNLNENSYRYSTFNNMWHDEMLNHNDHSAEKDSLIETIDPNDDAARTSGMLQYWYNFHPSNRAGGQRVTDIKTFVTENVQRIDSLLTNQANKRNLYYQYIQTFLSFEVDKDTIVNYISSMPQLKDETRLRQLIEDHYAQKQAVIGNGSAVPTDPTLIAPDGAKVNLSEVLSPDKVTYIDLWATWCGPCCAEIPYLEKLVEAYAGNNQIQFISISCDEDHDSWKKKLAKDNPQWPQYVLDGKTGREFMDAMNAHSIPRFFIIGHDGKFIEVDAARPSDENIKDILNQAINQ